MATTWNPSDKTASVTLSGGNNIATTSGVDQGVRATNSFGSKTYCETKIGHADETLSTIATTAFNWATMSGGQGSSLVDVGGGTLALFDWIAGAPIATSSGSLAANDIIGWALDGTKVYISKNGTWILGNPAAGTGFATLTAGTYLPAARLYSTGGSQSATLQADTTTYSPPTGFTIIGGGGPVGYTLTADAGTYALTGQAVPLPVGLVPLNTFQNAAGGTTTATIGTHAAGDLLIAWAFRDGSTTQATLPAGWTSITTRAGTTCAGRLAFKVAASSSETSGTWTNATDLIIAVYRGVDRVGASAVNSGTGNINYPALTLPSGAAWVLGAAGHRSVNTALETPPTGMTNRRTQVDATDESALHDTNGIVSSWSSTSVTLGGTSSGWVSIVAELIPKYSGVPAAGYTLTADPGSYTLTGIAAGLKATRTLTAAAGAYAMAGQAAGLKRGLKLIAAQGSYALTGVAAGLKAARRITADTGSYAYTGISATLTYVPATAAYTLTAEAGSYTLTGQAASLRASHVLVAAQGSYALTGMTAGLKRGLRLDAAKGTYSLTGQAAALRAARKVAAAPGSYVLTGNNAGLTYAPAAGAYVLTAEAGSYVLAGRDAGLVKASTVEHLHGSGPRYPRRGRVGRLDEELRQRLLAEQEDRMAAQIAAIERDDDPEPADFARLAELETALAINRASMAALGRIESHAAQMQADEAARIADEEDEDAALEAILMAA